MSGVIWRERVSASPARPAAATAFAALVFARVTLRRIDRRRAFSVWVSAFCAVARNPMSSRLACGPSETGSAWIGLYSESPENPAGPAAGQRPAQKAMQQAIAAAGTNVPNLGIHRLPDRGLQG
jgi:hypothetical protein